MTKILLIVMLFGGLSFFSYTQIDSAANRFSEGRHSASASSAAPIKQATQIALVKGISDTSPSQDKVKKFNFTYVNKVSLSDSMEDVIRKLGQPITIKQDSDLPELQIYQYKNMTIGFSDKYINYIEIPVEAGVVDVDGIELSLNKQALETAFGKPDFEAEDGIVFQRNDALLKLFTDMETQKVTSLHYYHRANV